MGDQDRTNDELLAEIASLRQRLDSLQESEARCRALAESTKDIIQFSEEKYRMLVEASPDAVLTTDLAGHVTLASRRAVELYGAARAEELLGRDPHDFFAPEDYSRFLANLRATVEGGITRDIEYTLLRNDGSRFFGEVSAAAIRDSAGTPIAVVAFIRDITARKQAEEALRRSERRFRNYFDQGLVGMAVTSLDKRWLEVNDRLCQIMGRSREELLQSSWEELTHPGDVERNQAVYARFLAGEIEHYTIEKRFLTKHGGVIHCTIHVRAFRNDDGSIDHLVSLTEDITAQKVAEGALRKQQRTLKHLLQSSDHERQLIAYEIHDGLAQQLAGAIMQFQTYAYQKSMNAVLAEAAYDAGMTMLRQAHFEARRLIAGVRPPILDESGVIEAVAHLVHEQRRSTGRKIQFLSRVDFDRLVPTLENAVYRIAQEALTNACRHSDSPRVRVGIVQRGARLRIEVRDWGVGFELAKVPDDRFGLQGIRERTRLLGGKCRIQSAPGEGTVVIVHLPVVQAGECC